MVPEQITTGRILFTETNRKKCTLQMTVTLEHEALRLGPVDDCYLQRHKDPKRIDDYVTMNISFSAECLVCLILDTTSSL